MAAPILVTDSLTLRRANIPAPTELSLEFEPGKLTAVVGPAGSGKTALMRCLAGFTRTGRDTISVGGVPIGRKPAHRRGFGVVRQPDHLFAHLTVAENVALPLRLRRVKRATRKLLLREMLELTLLSDAAERWPHQAGPAEHRRALLARAAVFGPSVLLLDEPFAGADEAELPGLVAIVRRLQEMLGATTVLATRSLRQALPLCDRVVVLEAGAVAQSGTAEEVFGQPASPFVAGLAGEANVLAGIVETTDDDTATIRLACGPVVEARQAKPLAAGEACLMIVRPEHIAIAPGAAADMGEGALEATLLEIQFWGDTYRMRLLIGSGAELIARRPTLAGLRGLSPGQQAAIAWQPHHALAYKT